MARVEALLAQADVIERAAEAVSKRIADVERAVLARAFRGELVERDAGNELAQAAEGAEGAQAAAELVDQHVQARLALD